MGKLWFFFPLTAVLLMGGCVGSKNLYTAIEYYTLEYDPPAATDARPLSAVVGIRPFVAAPAYDTNLFIYRDQAYKRGTNYYHRWRVKPGMMVASSLTRDMQETQLFRAVVTRESRVNPGYWLEGHIAEFLERDTDEGWQAILAVTVTLAAADRSKTGSVLLQKTYRATEIAGEKSPAALAAAMSRAMAAVSPAIIRDVYGTVLKSSEE